MDWFPLVDPSPPVLLRFFHLLIVTYSGGTLRLLSGPTGTPQTVGLSPGNYTPDNTLKTS